MTNMSGREPIFGGMVKTLLPTKFGNFYKIVLPEYIPYRNETTGEDIYLVIEHDAMVPVKLDHTQPVDEHFHFKNIYEDVFRVGTSDYPSEAQRKLDLLNRTTDGVLISLSQATTVSGHALPSASKAAVGREFMRQLGLKASGQRYETGRFLNQEKQPAALKTADNKSFWIDYFAEYHTVDMPRRVVQRLVPQELRDAGAKIVKVLNHYALTAMDVAPTLVSPEELEAGERPPLKVRIHSRCDTGDCHCSLKCDCGDQLKQTLRDISETGGMVIYHDSEGRGAFLMAAKMLQYAIQILFNLDTYMAALFFGYKEDARDYRSVVKRFILDAGYKKVILKTNNPEKICGVQDAGAEVVGTERILHEGENLSLVTGIYMNRKRQRGHMMPEEMFVHCKNAPVAPALDQEQARRRAEIRWRMDKSIATPQYTGVWPELNLAA